jgi:CRP-like cAMP-binding protein
MKRAMAPQIDFKDTDRRLQSCGRLSASSLAALHAAPWTVLRYQEGERLARQGERPESVCLVLSGLVCRAKLLDDGGRQILSFHLAGDFVDVPGLFLATLDHEITALTPVQVARVTHEPMLALIEAHPDLGRALWRETVLDLAIQAEWTANVGRRTAYKRIAHLFCEVALRMDVKAAGASPHYRLPLTQAEIADVVGLSVVHVNRVLQQLRAEKLITFAQGRLTVLDREALRSAGGFSPDYLHHLGRMAA